MVDIGRNSGENEQLRERIRKLTTELDEIEARHESGIRTLREAMTVLGGLIPPDQAPAVKKALTAFKKTAAAKKLDQKALSKNLEALKNAIVLEPSDYGPGASAKAKETAQAQAARHVSLALLHGLRMGDESFDSGLDKAIDEIGVHIAAGAVRPAMAILVDLLDGFRDAQNQRLKKAEWALKEVVSEVLRTESELFDSFSRAAEQNDTASKGHADRMSQSLATLLSDINSAPDLDTLRSRAIAHIRLLRDQIKDRRAQEMHHNEAIRTEMEQVRRALDQTQQSMADYETLTAQLSKESLTDPLTKIWNKRAFSQHLEAVLNNFSADGIHLIVFDIDHFKNINDTFGHKAGDRALEAIAKYANSALRKDDTLFRYAGDEFVILMHDINTDTAQMVAERVRQAAEKIRFTYGGKGEIRLTLSLGLSGARADDTPESLFDRADQALLEAKRQGRNRTVVS